LAARSNSRGNRTVASRASTLAPAPTCPCIRCRPSTPA
jgi:hypothetical protein